MTSFPEMTVAYYIAHPREPSPLNQDPKVDVELSYSWPFMTLGGTICRNIEFESVVFSSFGSPINLVLLIREYSFYHPGIFFIHQWQICICKHHNRKYSSLIGTRQNGNWSINRSTMGKRYTINPTLATECLEHQWSQNECGTAITNKQQMQSGCLASSCWAVPSSYKLNADRRSFVHRASESEPRSRLAFSSCIVHRRPRHDQYSCHQGCQPDTEQDQTEMTRYYFADPDHHARHDGYVLRRLGRRIHIRDHRGHMRDVVYFPYDDDSDYDSDSSDNFRSPSMKLLGDWMLIFLQRPSRSTPRRPNLREPVHRRPSSAWRKPQT